MRLDLAGAEIVAKLAAAGVPAALDPRDLDPPAVWVAVDTADTRRFGAGQWKSTWRLTVVAGDTGTGQALRTLGDLSDRLAACFGTLGEGQAVPIILPGGPDPMPALQYTVDLVCTDDTPTTKRK